MADTTHIEWTDATWNIITGCSLASPGCTNCYAMGLAGSRLQHHPSRAGLTTPSKAGPVWNGQVRFNAEWLTQPLKWKRPRKVFVCAHGDLFHESVPDAWIDQVFAVMALAPQHTFQVLTKRSARMREYVISRTALNGNIAGAAIEILIEHEAKTSNGVKTTYPARAIARREEIITRVHGGLPNVWLGVSVEDQKRADERIPDLLATPAAVRWISAEPLLGPLDLREGFIVGSEGGREYSYTPRQMIHWVVVGGESGPNARPMHPEWARSLRDQCASAGVPFLFKQWGAWQPICQSKDRQLHGEHGVISRDGTWRLDHDIAGPPEHVFTFKIGKTRAGRLIDGIGHNGYPEAR